MLSIRPYAATLTVVVAMLACGCAEGAADEVQAPLNNAADAKTDACACTVNTTRVCECPTKGQTGLQICQTDCKAWSVCTGCSDALVDSGKDATHDGPSEVDADEADDGGKGGSGGHAGAGGGKDAGHDGDSGKGGAAGHGGSGGSTGGTAGAGGGEPCTSTVAGDTCPGIAIQLTGSGEQPRTGSVSGSSVAACPDYTATGCNKTNNSRDLVYFFTPDITGQAAIDTTGSTTSVTGYDPVIYVRTTCDDAATEVRCNDQTPPHVDVLSIPVIANTTYFVILDAYSGTAGDYVLNVTVSPPVCGNNATEGTEQCDDGNTINGDGCDEHCQTEPAPLADTCPGVAIQMSGSGTSPRTGSIAGTTVPMQDNYSGYDCGSNNNKDAVYSFTSDVGGAAVVKVIPNSGFDPVVYVRTNCTSDSSEIDCVDGSGTETISLDAAASTPYYVFVDGYSTSQGTYTVQVTVTPAVCGNNDVEGGEQCDDGNTEPGDGCDAHCQFEPAGPVDTCPGALMTLTPQGSDFVATLTGTTANLNSDYTGGCGSSGTAKDAVYQMNSPVAGHVTATLVSSVTNFDSVLFAHKDNCASGAQLACDDNGGDGGEEIEFDAIAGASYWLFVDGYYGDSGTYQLHVLLHPSVCGNTDVEAGEQCDDGNTNPGDGCDGNCQFEPAGPTDKCPGSPLTLTQQGFEYVATVTGTTSNLFSDYGASCGNASSAKDAVYLLNSATGGPTTVTLAKPATNFDTVLYVRTGSCNPGTEIDCEDTTGQGGETIHFDALPNTDYWIIVDGYSSATGTYQLVVTVKPPTCGNGDVEGNEECDDMNTLPGDGCAADCTWEGTCGTMTEVEPNTWDSPQQIPAQCGSFLINGASLPTGDADYFRVNLIGGSVITASTFVTKPGLCQSGQDTMLSLHKGPLAAMPTQVGACSGSFIQCNDDDTANSPCSTVGPYTVPNYQAGEFIVEAFNHSSTSAITNYGLVVTVY